MEYVFAERLLEMHSSKLLVELNALYSECGIPETITLRRLNCVVTGMYPSLLIVRDKGRIVGCGIVSYAEALRKMKALIHEIIVHPSHKRQGLKKLIHARLVEAAAQREAEIISL